MRSATTALVLTALVLVMAYLVTTRALPWTVSRLLRRLGFREMSPVTRKRIARFKRIKRGYFCFVAIVTLFFTSLFLELLVNGRAIAIHYEGRTAFPAVAEWASKVLFFTNLSYFQKKSDFGQAGEDEVDYRRFAEDCARPDLVRAKLAEDRQSLEKERADLKLAEGHIAELKAAGTRVPLDERMKVAATSKEIERLEAELAERERSQSGFASGDAWCVMPIYCYGPYEHRFDLPTNPPNAPSLARGCPLGTDESGRDVLVLLLYGFRISLSFALFVWAIGYAVGTGVGAVQGYYGGWMDIGLQRIEEIWGSIPFLYTIMIVASLVTPTFALLIVLFVVLTSWLGITAYTRAEFYREKAKDYVQAAIGCGVSDIRIMVRHILPNALVPLVTFSPFVIVSNISSLVMLDYLGFGLPPGTPSWGKLLEQGLENVKFCPHLITAPSAAFVLTLFALVLVGEAVREAFDPKVFSRLR